jgi:hypothetical protein
MGVRPLCKPFSELFYNLVGKHLDFGMGDTDV